MSGGVPGQAMERALALARAGYAVTIVGRGNQEWNGWHEFGDADERISLYATLPKDFKLGGWIARQWFHPLLPLAQKEIVRAIHDHRPIDLAILLDSQGYSVAEEVRKASGARILFNVHGSALMPVELPSLLKKQSPMWEAKAYRMADLVVPVSDYIARLHETHFGTPKRREVISNGIRNEFQPIDRNRPVRKFGFVGRLEHDKRPLAMIDAMKFPLFPAEAQIRIVGGGSLQAVIGQRIDGLENVSMSDGMVLGIENMIAELGAMDCFVWTAEAETQGVAAIEAMATGLPIIAPKIDAAFEILGDQYPAIVEVDDVETLASMMRRMIEDDEFSNQCRDLCLQIAARFYSSVTMPRFVEVCRELIDSIN